MTAFRLSPKAESDLSDIWDYTVRQWDREQAERYLFAIRDRIRGVADGRVPQRSAEDIRPGYLKCAAGSHMIYFRRGVDGTIEVMRVLHQSMDVETQLRKP